jgi:ribosomal protein L37AE/L43A
LSILEVPYPKALRLFPEIRQSLLSSFNNCALTTSFELKFRHAWSHPYQARGEMFHRFAARALTEMAMHSEDGTIPVGEALEILHEVLRQRDADRVCPRCGSTRVRKGITKRGMRYCLSCKRQFETEIINVPMDAVEELYWVVKKWAHDNAFDVHNIVDVEKRLDATVRYENPISGGWVERKITGKLDALLIEGEHNEHAIVPDWKDMWKLPPETEIGFGGYFQQRVYAYLVFSNYPTVESLTLREFYVRYSQPREATLIRALVEEDIKEEISGLVERFDRCVQETLWNNPSPGAHCSWCSMPHKCTIFPEARGSGRIESHGEAATVAAQYLVAKAIVKQQAAQLKAWVNMHGPVAVRDAKGRRVVGFQEYERTEKPTIEQIEQAEREKGAPLTSTEIAALHKTSPSTRLTEFVPQPQLVTDQDDEWLEKLKASVAAAQEAA